MGSKFSTTYHDPSCVWAKSIARDRRTWFGDAQEAEKAGYEPCGECIQAP